MILCKNMLKKDTFSLRDENQRFYSSPSLARFNLVQARSYLSRNGIKSTFRQFRPTKEEKAATGMNKQNVP